MAKGDLGEMRSELELLLEFAPRIRSAGVLRFQLPNGTSLELAASLPGAPMTERDEQQKAQLAEERQAQAEAERRRIQLAASGGIRRPA